MLIASVAISPSWIAAVGLLRYATAQVVEHCHVVENIDVNTNIVFARYQRVWPTAQRELLNVCHCRRLSGNEWLAVTNSIEHPDVRAVAPRASGRHRPAPSTQHGRL